ncbi:uncharacterized protein LAJ45_00814 [Morchella importuna]|uniref:Rhodopsin domain-containing protein n=1 Tax=Morchella conica CCBAS932 TaxID=1392247 RepID=A0A3N4KID7_9PEZI|nr:uncharacterized protein LAJ45_00814 [Morchella importuna]KAH8155802.1 hypothetical protein LAJ45_00814 [Morchella importuna]RPB10280.1 hypothetical protein P167DRAFT_607332 [Morchella conica CCBAS932]
MTPDELRVLPGGEEPIPRNGSWGGSRTGFYPADFIHPAAGSYPYPWEYEPEHKAEYLFALTIVMVVLSTLVVAVRIGSRVMLRTLGVDDWLIIGATLNTIAVGATIIIGVVSGGAGVHWWDLEYPEFKKGRGIIMSFHGAIYATAVLFIKLSILCFLRRLFTNTSGWMTKLIMLYIVVNIIFFVTSFFCLFFLNASFGLLYPLGGVHLSLEIAILILPMRMVWRLQLPCTQKIISTLILGLGGVVCIISVLRLYYFYTYITSFDATYNATYIYLYNLLECTLGIFTSSAPSMKAAYTHFTKPRVERGSNEGILDGDGSRNASQEGLDKGVGCVRMAQRQDYDEEAALRPFQARLEIVRSRDEIFFPESEIRTSVLLPDFPH